MEQDLQTSSKLLLLCFICDAKTCQLGLVNKEIRQLSEAIAAEMQDMMLRLYANEEAQNGAIYGAANAISYDPMKDFGKTDQNVYA